MRIFVEAPTHRAISSLPRPAHAITRPDAMAPVAVASTTWPPAERMPCTRLPSRSSTRASASPRGRGLGVVPRGDPAAFPALLGRGAAGPLRGGGGLRRGAGGRGLARGGAAGGPAADRREVVCAHRVTLRWPPAGLCAGQR